jgi:uncharacterized LabA/DUF88 family protein
MESVRSALYLDFDNVFSALAKLDPKIAMSFAEKPQAWLPRLAHGGHDEPPRRWLVLRCYMNPAGWIPHPDNGGARLYFSKFRPHFTNAGFEVIDCPRLSHTKNGADIRLVIDAVEALRAEVRYEEFVIASGDSDMTPLVVRLRAADRRTTLLSPSDSAVVLGAVVDRLIGGEELLELLESHAEDLDEQIGDAAGVDRAGGLDVPELDEAEAKVKFGELVVQRYNEASEPMNLATLAHELRRELGPVTSTSRWFGYDGFSRALQSLDLPGVKMSHHFIWDITRHTAPLSAGADEVGPHLPEPVVRVTTVLKLPALQQESWLNIYDALAGFVAAYEFNLTEATRWARDRLAERDIRVNRQAVGVVAHGAAYGGCPLYRQPPPEAEDIGAAFVANVLNRAAAADIDLSSQDIEVVRTWFGVSVPPA